MSAQTLARIANQLRRDVITMDYQAGAGHVAGPMGAADLFAVMYFSGVAKVNPADPWWEGRDRIILSCGHYCPVLYATLSRAGFFPTEELSTFMQIGSRLTGHPERRADNTTLPGVEVDDGTTRSGSIGRDWNGSCAETQSSIRQLADKYQNCGCSAGILRTLRWELQEGQVWEAFEFAARRQLANLTYIVDANKIQIERYTSQVVAGEITANQKGLGSMYSK